MITYHSFIVLLAFLKIIHLSEFFTHRHIDIYTYLFSHSLLNLLDGSSKTVNLLLHVNPKMY